MMTVEEAIRACGAGDKIAKFHRQMKEFTSRLEQWLKSQGNKVSEAYLSVQGNGLYFLVVMSGTRHDEVLEDSLSELDFDLANDQEFDLIRMETMIIPKSPKECVNSFLGNTLHG